MNELDNYVDELYSTSMNEPPTTVTDGSADRSPTEWIRLPKEQFSPGVGLSVGLSVPSTWPEWTDDRRLAWVRGQLDVMGRPKGQTRAVAGALRRLRHRIQSRMTARAARLPDQELRQVFFVAQRGLCAACGEPLTGVLYLDADAAVLCSRCIVLSDRDPAVLRAIADYFEGSAPS